MEDQTVKNNFEEEESDFNLKGFLFNYLRYWYIYALALIIAMGCAYFHNWYEKPVYNISTKILIKDDKSTSIGTQELLKDLDVYNVNKNIENEVEIIKSRKIIGKTLENIEVDVLYYLVGNLKKSQVYKDSPFKINYDSLNFYAYNNLFYIKVIDEQKYQLNFSIAQTNDVYKEEHSFGEKIHLKVGTFTVNKRAHFDKTLYNDETYAKRNFRVKFNNKTNNIEFYLAKLKVEQPGKNSSVVVLGMEDEIPQRGIDILNSLVQVYLENDILEKNKIASSTANFIKAQLGNISVELKEIETARQDFKIAKGITDVSSESQMILEKVKRKDNDLSNYNLQLSFIDYLDTYVKQNQSIADIAPSSLGINDPLLVKLIGQITDLEIKKQELEIEQKEESPALKSINQQIEYTRKKLLQNIESIKTGLVASKDVLLVSLASLEKELKSIPQTERELVSIERE